MDTAAPEKGSAAWTEAAKFQFLLRIVAQLKEDGRAIKWDKISIPGRTIKSLKNMWTKINKQIADFEAGENEQGSAAAAAAPAKGARKKRGAPPKKNLLQVVDDNDDEDYGVKKAVIKKRAGEELEDAGSGVSNKRPRVKAEAGIAVRCKQEK